MSVLVDTSVIAAALSARDRLHARARRLLREILEGRWGPAYVTDYIVDEVLTYMLSRGGAEAALKAGRLLLERRVFRILPVSIDVFLEAWRVFRENLPRLSFTDASTVAATKAYSIDYIATFDEDLASLHPSIP